MKKLGKKRLYRRNFSICEVNTGHSVENNFLKTPLLNFEESSCITSLKSVFHIQHAKVIDFYVLWIFMALIVNSLTPCFLQNYHCSVKRSFSF